MSGGPHEAASHRGMPRGASILEPSVLGFEFLQASSVGSFHAVVLGEPAMPSRFADLEVAAHLIEFLTGSELLVALGELADDLDPAYAAGASWLS